MSVFKVSMATYNEILSHLEKDGRKFGDAKTIQLEKTDILMPPIDMRLVTIRRDCADIASKTHNYGHSSFVNHVKEIYEYVLSEKVPSEIKSVEDQLNDANQPKWK